jgi:hypothetical protein
MNGNSDARLQQTHNQRRADRIVSTFLQSRYWDNRRFGVNSDDWISDPDRMQRCEDAAAAGADGSTHRETIEDMREAFRAYLHDKRNRRAEYPYRVETIVLEHFDQLETWHEANGTADQEIG